MTGPYGEAAKTYWTAGWANPIPVRAKRYPVAGYTGYEGNSVSFADLSAWTDGSEAQHNIALRMAGTIAIDIDAHDGEIGNETMLRACARLGDLPPTWSSTSRGQGESRILIYKLPIGCGDLNRELEYAEKHMVREFGPNVEILHRGHRYAIVWPSVHPDTGEMYRWYRPNGEPSIEPPKMRELAELPITWWEFMTAPPLDEVAVPAATEHTSSLFGPTERITGNGKTLEDAAALLVREVEAFTALTTGGNQRTQKLNNLALLAGHGVPDFWSAAAAEETLLGAARESGYVGEHGERTALVQVQRGLADGARDPWRKIDVTYTREVQAPAVSTGRLRKAMLKRSQMRELPKPVPLIEHVLFRESIMVLSGKFGTYKSFVAVGMACALAAGKPWMGFAVPKAVPVIYAAAEGAYGIEMRVQAWEAKHGPVPDDFHLLPISARITNRDDMAELSELIAETGAQVVVFDTLHASTPGADEDKASDMGPVVDTLRMLREQHGVATILPHHTGHEGKRARGSSSIEDDADVSFVIELQGEDRGPATPRVMRHRKTKDEALLPAMPLILELVEGTGSGFVRLGSEFEQAAGTEQAPDRGQQVVIREPQPWTHGITRPDADVQRQILQALHDMDALGTVGRTEAQIMAAVADRWYGGKTGRTKGTLNKAVFGKAWTAVVAKPEVCPLGGAKFAIDPLSISDPNVAVQG